MPSPSPSTLRPPLLPSPVIRRRRCPCFRPDYSGQQGPFLLLHCRSRRPGAASVRGSFTLGSLATDLDGATPSSNAVAAALLIGVAAAMVAAPMISSRQPVAASTEHNCSGCSGQQPMLPQRRRHRSHWNHSAQVRR